MEQETIEGLERWHVGITYTMRDIERHMAHLVEAHERAMEEEKARLSSYARKLRDVQSLIKIAGALRDSHDAPTTSQEAPGLTTAP